MISCKDFSESACPYVRRGCYQNRCGCHELQHSYNDLKLVFQEDNNVFRIYDFSVNKSMCRAESQVDLIQKAAKTDLIRWEEGFITPVDGYVKIAKDPVVEKLSEILDVMEECERSERKRKRTERREKRRTQVMRRYSYQETLNSMGTTMSPLSGTQSSGYSTDVKSSEEYHSDTDRDGANANRQFSYTQSTVQRQLRKYFLLMPNGSSMALKVDPAQTLTPVQLDAPVQLDTKRPSGTNDISMSDLSLPDHSGWMIWQSGGGKRVWCAVVDMILCVCENDQAERPMEVLLLPGCNIRPLIYKTAINGLKTRSNTNTITGIGKYQMVIDNCSTRRKHIFSVENQASLNVWVNVLENASNLDPDSINGMTLERRSSLNSILQEGHNSGCTTPRYIPSSDSSNRVQKVSNCGTIEAAKALSTQNGLGDSQQESQFQGQSLQEFRKRLRGLDTEHEQSKHVPIKARHFEKAPSKESKPTSSKKIRSFGGSLESLLKFRKRKSKKDLIDTSSMEDAKSVDSMSSGGQTSLQSMEGDTTSYPNPMATPFDIGNSSSTKKLSGKSRTKDTNIIRRASDLKERVITKRDSKSTIRLGDLTDCSIHGHLYCKHLLKWLKHWCAVCHGCFYSFKSQSPEDPPHFAILLNQCTISILSEQERKHKRKFVFKLSRPNSKSLYLSAGDNNELSRWVQVLHMEANNVQSDIVNKENQYTTDHKPNDPFTDSIASFRNPIQTPDSCVSGHNYSNQTNQENDPENRKQAPVKPPRKLRNSSCPPTSRTTLTTPEPSVISSSEDCDTSGSASSIKEDNFALARPSHSLQSPTHDRAVTHVWQNDRGYLFNVIRSKLKAYRKRKEESAIAGLTTNVGENMLVIDDDTHVQSDARTETVVKVGFLFMSQHFATKKLFADS